MLKPTNASLNQVSKVERPEKSGIDLNYLISRFERGSEEQKFLKKNIEIVGNYLRKALDEAFNYANHILEDNNQVLAPTLLDNKEFQLRVFKDLYTNFTKVSSNDPTQRVLESSILAKLTFKTELRMLVMQASKISDVYFEVMGAKNNLTEIEELKTKISDFDPELKIEDLEKKVESLKLEIIELRKEKQKIESGVFDLSKIEFPESVIAKFNNNGIGLTHIKSLIDHIDGIISAAQSKKNVELSISVMSLESFRKSLIRFISKPTSTNLEYIENKRDSFNNNPFLSGVRSIYAQTFRNIRSFKSISLEENEKELLNPVGLVNKQIDLKTQKIEEYKLYPEIFKLQSETNDVEKYYKDNQLDPKSIVDLKNRIKISQNYLGTLYQQIINGNPEFFKLDLMTIKNYSQGYPKTIEAFLTLMLDVSTEELQAINSADVKKLQLAFVGLSDVIRSNSDKEFNQDFYRLKFLSKIIE